MGLSESLLPEFDNEMANTRKSLERVPDDKFGWKPHEKSSSMGNLAGHLANLPSWGSLTLSSDSFDLAPGGQPVKSPELNSSQAVLEKFDENVAATRAAIASAKDEDLFKPWTLMSNGKTILTILSSSFPHFFFSLSPVCLGANFFKISPFLLFFVRGVVGVLFFRFRPHRAFGNPGVARL